MRLPRAYAATAASLGTLLLVTGCGGETEEQPTSAFGRQTVAQIASAVRTDMGSARSFTVRAETADKVSTLTVTAEGDCTGTIEEHGGTAEVIETEDGSFVRGDEAYWLGQATTPAQRKKAREALDRWDGRWVRTPRGEGDLRTASYLDPVCDFAWFAPQVATVDPDRATKGEEREIDGVPAISLTSSEGDATTTVWISTDVPHRVVELSEDGADAATYDFRDYDARVEISTPDASEVYDLAATQR